MVVEIPDSANPKAKQPVTFANNVFTIENPADKTLVAYGAVTPNYYQGNTTHKSVLLIYDNNGQLIQGLDQINTNDGEIDAAAKTIIIAHPTQTNTYLMYYRLASGTIKTATINQNPTTGDVQITPATTLGNNSYGRHMAAIEDRKHKKAYLYTTMHNTTDHTTSIVKIEINALGEATQNPQSISENFTSYDTQGNGEIQISTDGNYLSYYNTNSQAKANPWTQTSQAEIRRWKITNQYTLESNATTIPIARHIGKGSLADNGTTLYYTQHSDEVGKEYQIHQYNNNGQHSTQIITGDTELRINTENNAYYYPQGTQGGQQYQPAPSPLQTINTKQTNTGYQAYHPYVINNPSGVTQGESYRYVASKKYEIKDHLGNVRVVVSDRKESLKAQVASYGNFYPFGMQQPGRNFNDADGAYRYGFQGQEKDDELKGDGNSINYKYRMHDPRLGRFFAVDPLTKKYPHYSPYSFSGNKVIHAVELEGLEEAEVNGQISGSYTFGKKGTSHFNVGFSVGASARNNYFQGAINVSGNITNGGLGSSNGQKGNMMANLVISPSLTGGTGTSNVSAPLYTFQSDSMSSVNNNFSYSGTIGQNFVFSTENSFQRVGSYGIKSGDISLSLYNDTKKFLGDGGDRWWTGGGSLTITNFLGSGSSSLRIGNDVFTGNSIPDMKASAEFDALMPTYNYGKNKSKTLNYAGQNPTNQRLNMGQSYLRLNTSYNIFQFSHSGSFDMFSQDGIHDIMNFHRFLSTTQNQFNGTVGASADTK